MKGRNILTFSLAAILSVGLASCKKKTESAYVTTYTADMYTMDYLNTYHAADSEVLVNLVDGLVEHDVYGLIRPALAESWTKTVVAGNDVWTFKLREGAQWVTNEGEEYAEVVADDFVAGMHHLLDTQDNALGYIVWGVIKNAVEYSMEGTVTDFAQVGVKAKSKYEVEYTLEGSVPYFMKMLQYNPFMPLNRDFFLEQGGAFGVEDWTDASELGVSYGRIGIPSSILYNGAYLFSKYASKSVMELTKNEAYWDVKNVKVDSVKYIYDDGSNPTAIYNAFKNGQYTAIGVGSTVLPTAQNELGNNLYVADTNSTTYFGAFNLNRRTYSSASVVSTKTEAQKVDTKAAILNKNFRKSIQTAFDKSSWNAVTVGETLKNNALRNTLTAPEFVSLPTTAGTYAAGTTYGDVVESEYKVLNPEYTGSFDDGQDGFYSPSRAVAFKALAKQELSGEVTFPIHLDIIYNGVDPTATNSAEAFKQGIEAALNNSATDKDYVVVELVAAANRVDFLSAGYRAASGADANYDFFYGSGWGPDYGDPLTYVNIFGYGNDMMTVIGIGNDAVEGGYEASDEAAYFAALPDYTDLLEAAKPLIGAARYVAFAQAEANLLDSGVVSMTTTQGGNYALTRVQPRTIPYTLFGTDNEKFKSMVIKKDILTTAEVASYKAAWATAKAAAYAAYTPAGPLD